MASTRVFHWRHGWIPLDHAAELSKHHQAPRRPNLRGAKVDKRPAVPAGLVKDFAGGSAEKHLETGPDGAVRFTPERAALHERIIAGILGDHQPQQHPEYTLMGGGPAAGKSTMMDRVPTHDSAMVNADDIKAQLPEYDAMTKANDDRAASFTHEESSYVAKRALEEAFKRKVNVTLDGTGDSSLPSLLKKIDAARAAGYQVNGFYVTVPTEVAVQRAEKRAARTGRHVPRTVIEGTHRSVSQVFPQAIGHFDNVTLFDNTHGLTRVIEKKPGGKMQVLNGRLWREFLAKGA